MSSKLVLGWPCLNCSFYHHDLPDAQYCLMCGQARRKRSEAKLQQEDEPKKRSSFQIQRSCNQQNKYQDKNDEGSEDSLIAHLQQQQQQQQQQRKQPIDDPVAEQASEEGDSSEPESSSTRNLPQHANTKNEGSTSNVPGDPSTTPQPLPPQHQQQHHHHHQQQQKYQTSPQDELKGDENFLVGITPQYWAHVPMLIGDILHNLTLSQGGINFLMPQQIPVSKCLLVGRIVWAQQTSESVMAYVLDDGTGLIDCICYHNNHSDAVYDLPSLLPISSEHDDDYNHNNSNNNNNYYYNKKPIALGTCVKIFGKIRNLAISHGQVLREINAMLIDPVHESFHAKNPEQEHWRNCSNFQAHCRKLSTILQPLQCLEILGTRIQSQVRAKRRLPSADDTLGAWRVFGTDCNCTCCQSIKDSLLYCHCQTKVVIKSDPQFAYRDALLKHLLDRQTKHVKKLVFAYQDIKQEESLRQVATDQAAKSDAKKQRFFQEELVRATIRALVKDGILFHIDQDNDQYLLITREKVLEPFVRDELERTGNTKNFVSLKGAPDYMKGVDLEKFVYIKRCIVQKENNSETKRQKVVAN